MAFDEEIRRNSDHVSMGDARSILAAKNPEAAKIVESIKAAATPSAPETTSPVHDKNVLRHMTAGEVRLAQAYLRVMDYFGPMASVKGIEVVTGKQSERTKKAFADFVHDHGKKYDLPSATATVGLLQSIIQEHDVFFQKKIVAMAHMAKQKPTDPLEHEAAGIWRGNLERAFEAKKADFGKHYDKIKTLHPEMRFPLMAAIKDLKIDVVIYEAYRLPEKQTQHVMKGESTAPPGYSFHGSGLAVDIYPADAKGRAIMNSNDPKWQQLYDVMVKHGFYSMMRVQKWDAPHHELVAPTGDMVWWPKGADGWKDIPYHIIPADWLEINKQALPHMKLPPTHTLPVRAGSPSQRQR